MTLRVEILKIDKMNRKYELMKKSFLKNCHLLWLFSSDISLKINKQALLPTISYYNNVMTNTLIQHKK